MCAVICRKATVRKKFTAGPARFFTELRQVTTVDVYSARGTKKRQARATPAVKARVACWNGEAMVRRLYCESPKVIVWSGLNDAKYSGEIDEKILHVAR